MKVQLTSQDLIQKKLDEGYLVYEELPILGTTLVYRRLDSGIIEYKETTAANWSNCTHLPEPETYVCYYYAKVKLWTEKDVCQALAQGVTVIQDLFIRKVDHYEVMYRFNNDGRLERKDRGSTTDWKVSDYYPQPHKYECFYYDNKE